MQAPVTNRSTITSGDPGSTSSSPAFATAAISAAAVKNRFGGIRSASPKAALARLPTTKPACTALVKTDC